MSKLNFTWLAYSVVKFLHPRVLSNLTTSGTRQPKSETRVSITLQELRPTFFLGLPRFYRAEYLLTSGLP
jgi:hypothetical protein